MLVVPASIPAFLCFIFGDTSVPLGPFFLGMNIHLLPINQGFYSYGCAIPTLVCLRVGYTQIHSTIIVHHFPIKLPSAVPHFQPHLKHSAPLGIQSIHYFDVKTIYFLGFFDGSNYQSFLLPWHCRGKTPEFSHQFETRIDGVGVFDVHLKVVPRALRRSRWTLRTLGPGVVNLILEDR